MNYYLIPNTLTNDGSYLARLVADKSCTEGDLIDRMLSKRNIASRADLETITTLMNETLVELIKEGKRLNLPVLKLGYGMKGTFATPDAAHNATDHPLEISINPGALLTEAVTEIKLKRVTPPDFGPGIERFSDSISKTVNSLLTPGGIFKITGRRLRIEGRDADAIGLYLRAEDGVETKVEVLLDNKPRKISGQLPADLPSGAYQLVVRTQVTTSGNRFVHDVRTGISSFSLTVE